jgi:cell division protein FtsB
MNTHDFTEFRHRRQQTVWHTLNRLLIIMILLAGAVMAVMYFLPEVHTLHDMKSHRDALQVQRDELANSGRQKDRQVELLKNDPEYVETIARDRLDLKKPGETVIRMDTPTPAPTSIGDGSQ